MKILHVLDRSVTDVCGYASRSQYIIEFQKRHGFTPSVISSPWHKYEGGDLTEINGITYFRSHEAAVPFKKVPFLREYLSMHSFRGYIASAAEKSGADIIHSHSPVLCGIPASQVAAERKVPFVYEVRALWEDAAVDQNKTSEGTLRYNLTRAIETWVLRRADRVITICQGLKAEISKRGIPAERIFVIPNGVDTEKFTPGKRDEALALKYGLKGNPVIGYIGSFYKFEGVEYILQSVSLITREIPSARFLIVGSGKEEAELKALAVKLGIEDKIIFTGRVPHADILRYYSIIDILVYPRLRKRITEMVTPLKPLEAMSLQKAVIGSNVGGIMELVDDGETGLLFKADDVEDLAAKSIMLLRDPALREKLGVTAREKMIKVRNWDTIISHYRKIYGDIALTRGDMR